jgi:hypothetical protein
VRTASTTTARTTGKKRRSFFNRESATFIQRTFGTFTAAAAIAELFRVTKRWLWAILLATERMAAMDWRREES